MGSIDLAQRADGSFVNEDRRWLGSAHGTQNAQPGTLDGAAALAVFPDGVVPSGTVLALRATSGRYEPYAGGISEETQTVTISATGGTFTLSFNGQVTGAIAWNATAAAVQAALEALNNIDPGDVVVTGANGGPYTVKFQGQYANENVPALVSAAGGLTGGAGTAVVATTQAGDAELDAGIGTAVGFLYSAADVSGGRDVGIAVLLHGFIYTPRLPQSAALDANARTDLAGRFTFIDA